jgi:hypothetical protein
MNEIFILVVAIFGFTAVIQTAILAHRRLLPCRLLQGVEWKSTSRLVRHSFSEGGKKVCLKRWRASTLHSAVDQAQNQRIEGLPG